MQDEAPVYTDKISSDWLDERFPGR